MKKIVVIISFLFIITSPASEKLYDAHKLYDNGNYSEAIKIYQKLLITEDSSAGYYNLGNFHFRAGELGKSLYYFRKASELSPRDSDILFNLDYTRKKATDKIEDKGSIWVKALSLKSFLSFREVLYLFSISATLFWIIAGIYLFKRNEWIKWGQKGAMIVATILLFSSISYYFQEKRFGVVIVDEAKVYSAVGKDNIVLFTLHEGAEFVVKVIKDDKWARIELADGKKGWIQSEKGVFAN